MQSSPSKLSAQDGELDLVAVLHGLWEGKWLILLITLACFSVGLFYSLKQKPLYETDVLLQIEDKKQNNTPIGGLTRKLDLTSASENNSATHAALIQSRFILEPVIKSLGLDIQIGRPLSHVMNYFAKETPSNIKIKLFETPAEFINRPFKLKKDKEHHIQLYTPDGALSLEGKIGSLLTNADHTIALQVDSYKEAVHSKYQLFKQSKAKVTQSLIRHLKIKDLGGKENTGVLQISLTGQNPYQLKKILDAVAEEAQLKDTEKKSIEASKALLFLYQQLPLAKKSLDKAETDLNLYRATSGKIDIKLQAQSLLTQLEELDKQLGTLRTSQIDMSQRYTSSHPFLIAIINQTKALELKRLRLEKLLKTLPASDQIAVNLMRDVEVKNSLYLILLSKIQELEFVKAGTVSNVRILSYAKVPDEPLPNHNRLLWLGSILLGLTLSVFIVFLKKMLNAKVVDPHWTESHFNLVNLAVVPYSKEQSVNSKKSMKESKNWIPLLAQQNSRHLSIESLRSLRTTLQVTLGSAPNNIVAILGITPGIGKTFITTNLAWLLAGTGMRVLLIDGDLRRGSLHRYFNTELKPGLIDVLINTCPLENVLYSSGHPNLTIIPHGSSITNPSEMLMNNTFKELLETLSSQFDIILIDTAPLLLVTDGVLIGRIAGTNYLVLGANTHHPSDINMVMKQITNAQVELHGSIFNHFKVGSKSHRFGGYHGYYYDETQTEVSD